MSALIFQQIPKVMNEISAISKDRNNQSQGYKFRGIDDVYNELHPLMAKHKIFSTTNVVNQDRSEKTTAKGSLLTYTILTIKFTFYAEDGSSVEVSTVGEGMDSGDKSTNKAMAVAHKYALMQLFAIPTEDDKDPENDSPMPVRQNSVLSKNETQKLSQAPKEETIGDYKITFGKWKGHCLSYIGLDGKDGLLEYVSYIEKKASQDGKPITGQVAEFIGAVKAYAATLDAEDNIKF